MPLSRLQKLSGHYQWLILGKMGFLLDEVSMAYLVKCAWLAPLPLDLHANAAAVQIPVI